jgi:hypothetical protein
MLIRGVKCKKNIPIHSSYCMNYYTSTGWITVSVVTVTARDTAANCQTLWIFWPVCPGISDRPGVLRGNCRGPLSEFGIQRLGKICRRHVMNSPGIQLHNLRIGDSAHEQWASSNNLSLHRSKSLQIVFVRPKSSIESPSLHRLCKTLSGFRRLECSE